LALKIVFQDERLLAIDKLSGLLAVPGLGPENQENLAHQVQQQFPRALVVHRLDRDTSGLILFALDPQSQRHLSRQFQERLVEKRYIGVVHGRLENESGRIELPLRRDFANPPRHRVDPVHGRMAVTDWRVLRRQPDRTRLELTPLTGRSHQLRIHMQQLGHPILGDNLYAGPDALVMADRLLLHAERIMIEHPSTGWRLCLTANCPF
jgi:tRNA pseudouridine32 synthase/23S rRNA pseudouridine746 synthase